MEENKNQEKNEHHEGKKCHGFGCKCSSHCRDIFKVILVVIIVFTLLGVGAALGAHRSARFNNFNNSNQAGFGCSRHHDGRKYNRNEQFNGCQFNAMRQQNLNEAQPVEIKAQINTVPANTIPANNDVVIPVNPIN